MNKREYDNCREVLGKWNRRVAGVNVAEVLDAMAILLLSRGTASEPEEKQQPINPIYKMRDGGYIDLSRVTGVEAWHSGTAIVLAVSCQLHGDALNFKYDIKDRLSTHLGYWPFRPISMGRPGDFMLGATVEATIPAEKISQAWLTEFVGIWERFKREQSTGGTNNG